MLTFQISIHVSQDRINEVLATRQELNRLQKSPIPLDRWPLDIFSGTRERRKEASELSNIELEQRTEYLLSQVKKDNDTITREITHSNDLRRQLCSDAIRLLAQNQVDYEKRALYQLQNMLTCIKSS
jgi:hypothetical protein